MPTVHVVPHTHWDREWYHPAARFQSRLARMVEAVLEGLEEGALPAFLLDGQAIILDDYLAARPASGPRLRRRLRSGRLEAGPWYVLADGLLVSGESLVRNLFEGARAVRRAGGEPMRVGYAPDAFGHPAALPTVLAGFGISNAVVWRGFGGERGQDGDLFRWRGPDGAEVLMIHLPPPGYEYGANLPAAGRPLRQVWGGLRAMLETRARSPHWLVMNGADHHAPQEALADAVDGLRRLAPDCDFVVSGLGTYARAVERWARRARAALPLVEGELREGRRHAWSLQGTHGTRLHLKQRNAECQRLLERLAEPVAALALRSGWDARAELWHAWRTLLENHPHDSICGTSHDAAHREMVARFDRCRALALESATRALDAVVGRDADAAREAGRAGWKPHLAVFNTVPRAATRLVEAEVALFRADVPVGQGSRAARVAKQAPRHFELRDARGRAVPYQALESAEGHDLVESSRHYPDADLVEWRRILFAADDLPALGVASYRVTERPKAPPVPRPTHAVAATDAGIENGLLWVRVESDGTIAVASRETGASVHGLAAIEDQDDLGDSYTSSPRGRPVTEPDHVAVRVVHAGPLRGEVEIVRRFDAVDLEVHTQVVLEAGSRTVGIYLEGLNVRPDHRVRVAFPSGVRDPRVVADGAFGPVERRAGTARPRRGELEQPSPTAPMQRWVAAAKGARGLAVIADGLPQYEVRADGAILVTVLRATGELSKADLPERPGHAGWPTATPEGQCIGPFGARLAVVLTDEAGLAAPDAFDVAADEFLVPPVARMLRACVRVPRAAAGPALDGEGLVFSAMKPAESGRGVVVRCYNARSEAVKGAWVVPWRVRAAHLCRLDETLGARLKVGAGGRVEFAAGPRAVVSVLLR